MRFFLKQYDSNETTNANNYITNTKLWRKHVVYTPHEIKSFERKSIHTLRYASMGGNDVSFS